MVREPTMSLLCTGHLPGDKELLRMKYETSWSFPYNEVLEERIFNKQQYKWKTFTDSAHIVLFRVTIILQDLNYYIVTYKYNWKVIFSLSVCWVGISTPVKETLNTLLKNVHNDVHVHS